MYGDFSAHATVRLDVQCNRRMPKEFEVGGLFGASLAPESYPESSDRSRQEQLLRPILIDGSGLVAGSRCLCLEIGDPQPQLFDDLPISSDFEQAAAPGGHRSEVGSVGHEMLPCTSSPSLGQRTAALPKRSFPCRSHLKEDSKSTPLN